MSGLAAEIGCDDLAVIHSDNWRRIVRIPSLPSLILDRTESGNSDHAQGRANFYRLAQPELAALLQAAEQLLPASDTTCSCAATTATLPGRYRIGGRPVNSASPPT